MKKGKQGLGAHKTKKKERKKEKERKQQKKGEPFSVAKKKGGKKDVSDVVSSLAWNATNSWRRYPHPFFFGCFLTRLFPSVFVV